MNTNIIDFNQEQLEKALPSLADKLILLKKRLNSNDSDVIMSIINSASEHLLSLNSNESESYYNLIYSKPISAVVTPYMKQYILDLPMSIRH